MTWVAVGSAVVALVGGIAGSMGEAKKRSKLRRLQGLNAQRLETQAQAVERQTQDDLVSLRQKLTKVIGSQRAGWGASGFTAGGSATDILAESITAGINDQRRRAEAGAMQAEDLRYQAKIGNLSASAQILGSREAGNQALIQGVGQAAVYGAEAYQKTR